MPQQLKIFDNYSGSLHGKELPENLILIYSLILRYSLIYLQINSKMMDTCLYGLLIAKWKLLCNALIKLDLSNAMFQFGLNQIKINTIQQYQLLPKTCRRILYKCQKKYIIQNVKRENCASFLKNIIIAEAEQSYQKPKEFYKWVEELIPASKYLDIYESVCNQRDKWVTVDNKSIKMPQKSEQKNQKLQKQVEIYKKKSKNSA